MARYSLTEHGTALLATVAEHAAKRVSATVELRRRLPVLGTQELAPGQSNVAYGARKQAAAASQSSSFVCSTCQGIFIAAKAAAACAISVLSRRATPSARSANGSA